MQEALMKPKEVAAKLNVSVQAVQKWARDGDLPFQRIGKKLMRFRPSDVEAFAQKVAA